MNKEFCVYLIIRNDGLQYIGKTVYKRLKYRIKDHLNDIRNKGKFSIGIRHYEVLFISNDHSEIEDAETFYVKFFNTFERGLNQTKDGKAKNEQSYKFTTFGMKHSSETIEKIRQKTSKRKAWKVMLEWRRNLTSEEKQKEFEKMSAIRKGKINQHTIKYKKDKVIDLYNLYLTKPFLDGVGTKSANGKILTYELLFCRKYSSMFGFHEKQALNIITLKVQTWKKIIQESILNIKF